MANYSEKLILTFVNESGQQKKLKFSHYLKNLDPYILYDQLATLPATHLRNEPLNSEELLSDYRCIHASYVEINKSSIFKI